MNIKSSKKPTKKTQKNIKKRSIGQVKKRKLVSKHKKQGLLSRLFFNRWMASSLLLMLTAFALYLIYLNTQITEKMSGRIWSLPSYVYARPLELYQSKVLRVADLDFELHRLGYKKTQNRPLHPAQYRILNNEHFEIISRDFTFWDGRRASRGVRLSIAQNEIISLSELYSDKKIPLFRLEPVKIAGIYPVKKQERQLVKLQDVPDDLVLALLAVEDRRFYQHWGIDPRSILRAFWANLMAGKTVQGGSTLTQQLVKNLFLSSDRTLVRKINEALMSLLIELSYDKSVILETYLNEVYLGQNGAKQIHGFLLASHFYFAKNLQQLSRGQMALLVGLVKGPSWYDPRRHPQRAQQRRNQVLALMQDQAVLSNAQVEKYSTAALAIVSKPVALSNPYPALISLVKRQLREDYSDEVLKSSGLKIFTSIDPVIQMKAETSVKKLLPQLEANNKIADNLQVSVIVASSQQGEIQAMVSDRNPMFSGYNRALDARRQVGSLIKPGIYLTALQQANKYTLASMLDDSPLHLKTSQGSLWSPNNYDKKFKGEILLSEALKTSRNVPTVRLGLALGLPAISATLHDLGIKSEVPAYPSMTLGAVNLSAFDVANMYQTFASGGFHVPLKVIREVLNKTDEPLKRYPLNLQTSMDLKSVFLVNHVLQQVTKSGTARYLAKHLSQNVAGKTGTTDDLRDSWFAGFSDNKLGVVWIGRDDNKSTGLTGASGALRLWSDLFNRLNINSLSLDAPSGIKKAWVDKESGGLSDKSCLGTVELPFVIGSEPKEKAACESAGIFQRLKGFFN